MNIFKKYFENDVKLNANEIAIVINDKGKSLETYLKDAEPVVLFDGSNSDAIELIDDVSNYKRIKIFARYTGGIDLPVVEIVNPVNKKFVFPAIAKTTGIVVQSKSYLIKNNKIIPNEIINMFVNSNKIIEYIRSTANDNWIINIIRVEGYKW